MVIIIIDILMVINVINFVYIIKVINVIIVIRGIIKFTVKTYAPKKKKKII